MHLLGVGLLCVAAATAGSSSPAAVSAYVRALSEEEAASTEQEVQEIAEDVSPADAPLPMGSEEEAELVGRERSKDEPAADQNVLLDMVSDFSKRVQSIADKYGPRQRGPVRMAWIGAIGMLFFFLLHFMVQYSAGKPVSEGLIFTDGARVSLVGAGLAMFAAVLQAGLVQIYRSKKKQGSEDRLAIAKGYFGAGKASLMQNMVLIALGWIFGVPTLLLQVFALAFFWSAAWCLLGVFMMLEEIKNRTDALRTLHKLWTDSVKPMNQGAKADSDLLMQVIEHFGSDLEKNGTDSDEAEGEVSKKESDGGAAEGGNQAGLDEMLSSIDADAMFDLMDRMLKPVRSRVPKGEAAAKEGGASLDRAAADREAARSAAEALSSFFKELNTKQGRADAATSTLATESTTTPIDTTVIDEEDDDDEDEEREGETTTSNESQELQ